MFDMGFKSVLNSILEALPNCHKILTSATLNSQIHTFSQMSLNAPERIFLHCSEAVGQSKQMGRQNIYETPAKLMQYYMLMKD